MRFTAKVFKLGNSRSIYIPKNVGLEVGKEYTFELAGKKKVYTPEESKTFNTNWCDKHKNFKGICGCE